jgi:hypothetical protein
MSADMSHAASPRKEKLFVSYHHDGDGYFFHEFCHLIDGYYQPIQDGSVERTTGCTDAERVMANLRSRYIGETVCTVVLCGAQTAHRRFVDWEIKASLDLSHGLIAVILPPNVPDSRGQYGLPARLADNLESGFAECMHLVQLSGGMRLLASHIGAARGKPARLIENSRELRRTGG